jgi:mono/diheme cytochrome c family protein
MWRRWRRWLVLALGAGVVLLLVAQLVPYGRDHANPPVVREPQWNAASTRELARTACFDCHSNLTTWPWYSSVAPFSWLVQSDVDTGRSILNFSEWNRPQESADEIGEAVREGGMPPIQYTLIHGDARLSDTQKRELADGLEATLRQSPPG